MSAERPSLLERVVSLEVDGGRAQVTVLAAIQTREIPLTQGKVAIVDAADYELLAAFKWFAERQKHTYYASRNYVRSDGKRRVLRMHCAILTAPLVDHRNGDGLDNRRSNLRSADRRGNGANASLSSRNKSGFKGVSWHKETGKWRADLGGKSLGLYDDPKEAARAYDVAAKEQFGEFARANHA